jgi:allophanate hydrolase subunit 2
VALLGPVLRAGGAPVRLALAGDFASPLTREDGGMQALGSWRSITLQPGKLLAVGPCRSGIGYLALAGGVDVPRVPGSRSSYARAGLGGIDGRAPRAADRLHRGAGRGMHRQALRPFTHAQGPMRVLPGPQDGYFDDEAWALFQGSDYRVTREADRMGLRLQGPPLRYRDGRSADIVSEALVPGAV